ncbi:MAG: tellurite resistance TerB family protein [Pseudomonadota bacterium]
MHDAKALLDQFLGSATNTGGQPAARDARDGDAGGFDLNSLLSGKGGLATGAIAGGLAGLLLGGKKPKKLAKSALKVGGAALVGGLAYKAWRDWQANKAPESLPTAGAEPMIEPAPAGTVFLPDNREEEESLSRALIRAMIAAAKADGHVTFEEQARISKHLEALELSPADRAFIDEELAKPLDIDAVARGVNCPEQAAELYAASLLVIDASGAAEKGYLAMLAARLKLDPDLVAHLHAGADSVLERESV